MQEGFLLDFASEGDFVRQVLVRGLGSDVQLGPNGGLVSQSGRSRKATLDVGYPLHVE